MTRIKKVVGALSTTFPELIVRPEDSAEVAVERVTALVHSLQGKVDELGAQLVPTMPPEVREERRREAGQLVEASQKTAQEYDGMLAEVVQTWSDLGGHLEKIKVQA